MSVHMRVCPHPPLSGDLGLQSLFLYPVSLNSIAGKIPVLVCGYGCEGCSRNLLVVEVLSPHLQHEHHVLHWAHLGRMRRRALVNQ